MEWMLDADYSPKEIEPSTCYPPEDFAEKVLGNQPLVLDPDWWEPIQNTTVLPEVVVTGQPRQNPGAPRSYFDDGGHNSDQYQPPQYTWEELTDCVVLSDGTAGLDGAVYVVPEGITPTYLINAINYLASLEAGAKELAFYEMYTNRGHPHFLDFKEAYQGLASQSYYSEAAGQQIVASAFEPFGNFIYGFVGVLGGIAAPTLRAAAAALQEGEGGPGFRDAPEDRPHVELGIALAQAYRWSPGVVFTVGNCGDPA
jgi:hypothetical protein